MTTITLNDATHNEICKAAADKINSLNNFPVYLKAPNYRGNKAYFWEVGSKVNPVVCVINNY